MRSPCTDCTKKHLAQALVITHELAWYAGSEDDDHLWVCIGHLGEAEAQVQKLNQFIADKIREQRLMLMQDGAAAAPRLDINSLIRMVIEFDSVEGDVNEQLLGEIPDMNPLADLENITKREVK